VLFDPCGPAAAARASDPAPAVSLEQARTGIRIDAGAPHRERDALFARLRRRNHLVVKLAITSFSESH